MKNRQKLAQTPVIHSNNWGKNDMQFVATDILSVKLNTQTDCPRLPVSCLRANIFTFRRKDADNLDK